MPPRFMVHPLARGVDIDSPECTVLRRRVISEKAFLRRLYEDWYRQLAFLLAGIDGPILEIGSGAGFLPQYLRGLISSEVFFCPGIDVVLDGRRLPFGSRSLGGVVMTNVLHHIPDVDLFFREAGRCVRPGGRMAMIEPWSTSWSRWVYTRLHHEPFDPGVSSWRFETSGPLSGANGALPWIIFHRDRERFEKEHPDWRIEGVRPFMPTAYLFSGGMTFRSLLPGALYPLVTGLERLLSPLNGHLAMFARIHLTRMEPS